MPGLALAVSAPPPEYEYQMLVTNLTEELLSVSGLYAQRADAENVCDELKNQWGWGGFTTKNLRRCQMAARNVALIYNGWNLFVRCAEPERPREAVTSRPLLLCAVGRVIESGRQITLRLTSTHGEAAADGREPVPERAAEHCGAVEFRPTLRTHLGADIESLAATGGVTARPQRLRNAAPLRPHHFQRVLRVDYPTPTAEPPSQLPFLG